MGVLSLNWLHLHSKLWYALTYLRLLKIKAYKTEYKAKHRIEYKTETKIEYRAETRIDNRIETIIEYRVSRLADSS